jgi:hypothetical protein
MSAQILSLASEAAVDSAWQSYVEEAARLADDPRLLCDRAFNEELTRRHERWRRLFLMQEGGR